LKQKNKFEKQKMFQVKLEKLEPSEKKHKYKRQTILKQKNE
jgi:hypothetical protein